MSWTHAEDTRPKARKRHWCNLCERWIEKGEVHVKRFGYGDDGPLSNRMHIECEEVTQSWSWSDWEDNYCSSTFREDLEAHRAKKREIEE